jgi:Fur family ferric uptake transcriptional regulator
MTERTKTPSPASDAWIELVDEELRRAGYRSSLPRTAVIELIGRQPCVLGAQEIADQLRDGGQRVGVATVYRTLELLASLKLVQRLDVGGAARYEPALPGGEHHHHLVCDRCGQVTPFEDPAVERAIDRLADRLEYRVGDHDVILRGICPRCSRA